MAPSSIDKQTRGFLPAQNDQERILMRHMEDLAKAALGHNTAKYSAFLSDREQALAQAAMNRIGCETFRFWGGYPQAERKVLCIEPEGSEPQAAMRCIYIRAENANEAIKPEHRDYLGSILGLAIAREAIGDLVLEPQKAAAYCFCLPRVAPVVARELSMVGRCRVRCEELPEGEVPAFAQSERALRSATVASLRLDAVLAAMCRCSRSMAEQLIRTGRVEINHVLTENSHAAVYENDTFTVRGKGKYHLQALDGKSRKNRFIIRYFKY